MSTATTATEKPDKAKWWLVTWSTYATWLPGDPRGFQTWRGEEYVPPPKRYAKPGEETYDAKEYAELYEFAKRISKDAVRLTLPQQKTALDAVIADIADADLVPAILAQGATHAHLLAIFGKLKIRTLVGRLKAAATRELHRADLEVERVWSRGCHMKSKTTRREYQNAYNYIKRHRDDGLSVHEWDVDEKYIPKK